MALRRFSLEQLEEWEVAFENVWSEEIDSGRWTRFDSVVFQAPDDEKYYRITVETGLTEYQEVYGEERYPEMENGVLVAAEVVKTTIMKPVTVWEVRS